MSNSVTKILCQIYLLLLLAVTSLLSPLDSPLALALFLIMLFIIFGRLPPRFNITITVATIFLLPLVLQPLLHHPLFLEPLLHYLTNTMLPAPALLPPLAVIATLPVLYLLDYYLRENAPTTVPAHTARGKRVTHIFVALLTTTLLILLASLMLGNLALLFAAVVLMLYLLAIFVRTLVAIPRLPLNVPSVAQRIIAGSTTSIPLHVKSRASMKLHSLINPVAPWLKVTPQRFTLNKAGVQLDLNITPPLAGPSNPQLQLSLTDPWGFIQIGQVIEPVELGVIPRAKYAYWLAMRYLEQTGSRGTGTSGLSAKANLRPRIGVEYSGSRGYQPGDRLKDVDWKHSVKLNELIIKEYIEAGEQAAIIAANLSVSDAEEADKLAFNLITAALTLAQELIPTVLAIYNHEKVILTTTVINPRQALKQTLSLINDITLLQLTYRFLEPPNIKKLRRNIAQLKPLTSEPAQRLLNILNFEYQAIEETAKNHPATQALSLATKHLEPPAIIILVSQLNHDVEALLVASERLSRRGFTTLNLEAVKQRESQKRSRQQPD